MDLVAFALAFVFALVWKCMYRLSSLLIHIPWCIVHLCSVKWLLMRLVLIAICNFCDHPEANSPTRGVWCQKLISTSHAARPKVHEQLLSPRPSCCLLDRCTILLLHWLAWDTLSTYSSPQFSRLEERTCEAHIQQWKNYIVFVKKLCHFLG